MKLFTRRTPGGALVSPAVENITRVPAPDSRRNHYLPTLDAWRAIAALLVVGCHAISTFAIWHIGRGGFRDAILKSQPRLMGILNGGLGVDLFFALSGFLITYLAAIEAESPAGFRLRAFWVRRTFRIVPLAWFYICCFLFLTCLTPNIAPVPSAGTLSAGLFFYINYLIVKAHVPGLLAHLWTLGLEMQFYFAWAVVLKLVRPKFLPIAALIGVLLVIVLRATSERTGFAWDGLRLESRGDSLLWGAFFGSLLATSTPERIRCRMPYWSFFPLALSLAYVADQHPFGFATWQPILCAILVTLTVIHSSKKFIGFMEVAPLRFLGRISFSIYIWQQLLTGSGAAGAGVLGRIILGPPWSLLWIVPVAFGSFYLIELPGIRFGAALTREKRVSVLYSIKADAR